MLDKLNVDSPLSFNSEFHRIWKNPMFNDLLRKAPDRDYEVAADLRAVDINARISLGLKHQPHKKNVRVELFEAGASTFSGWCGELSKIFKGDVCECSVMRIDTTVDTPGHHVSDYDGAVWAIRKAKAQGLGVMQTDPFGWKSKWGAQTLMYGVSPRQIEIYDKTLHREKVLLPALNKERARKRLPPLTFFEKYGYSPDVVMTRIERRMGGREPEERWGIRYLGDLPQLMNHDPFDQLRFPEHTRGGKRFCDLDPEKQMAILFMKNLIKERGMAFARSWLRRRYLSENGADSALKWWNRNEHLVTGGKGLPTREQLTAKFHETLKLQLAA